MPNGRPWTREDLRWLRRFRRDGVPVEDIADVLDRSVSSIRCKLVAAKIHGGRRFWSPADDETLKREYKKTPTVELASRLGRSVSGVRGRTFLLGLGDPFRWSLEVIDNVRRLHAEGLNDGEISRRLGTLNRNQVHAIRYERLKLPVNVEAVKAANRRSVVSQRRSLGIRHGGDLRRLAFRRFAERRGWPPETRPREVQILELLAVAGPLTKAQISERIGMLPKPRKTGRGFLYLCGNNRGSYTASMVAAGLVIRLPRAHQVAGKGRGHSCDLYMLSPAAMDIVINRVRVQENQDGKTKSQPQSA